MVQLLQIREYFTLVAASDTSNIRNFGAAFIIPIVYKSDK